jgi:hypothetical protein
LKLLWLFLPFPLHQTLISGLDSCSFTELQVWIEILKLLRTKLTPPRLTPPKSQFRSWEGP